MLQEKIRQRFVRITIIVLLYSIVSGALRKWVFTSGQIGNVLQMLQLIVPFFYLWMPNAIHLIFRQYRVLIFFLIYLVLCIFNPLNLTVYHGLLGFLIHANFWVMAFVYLLYKDYIYFEQKELNWFIVLVTAEIVLAFVQYSLPPGSVLNKYANIEQLGEGGAVAVVGSAVRVTGTFSYIGGFTSLVFFISFFAWSLLDRKANTFLIFFVLLGGLIAGFMSGSRGAVANYIFVMLLMIISNFTIKTVFRILGVVLLPALIFLIISLVHDSDNNIVLNRIQNSFQNFNERRTALAKGGEETSRVTNALTNVFEFNGKHPYFGVGLGATYQGATATFGTSEYVKEYGYYEVEGDRIIVEGGFILFIFRVILMAYFLNGLALNFFSKISLLCILIFFTPLVYNIYNSIFVFLGLMLVDNSIRKKNITSLS